MNNENNKCENGSCENEATTKSWKQPARIKTDKGYEIVPQKVLIKTCYGCDLWLDFKEYGTN